MDVKECFGWICLVCLMPVALARQYCRNSDGYCYYGCCDDYSFSYLNPRSICCSSIGTTYSPRSVVESTVNLAVIIGASVGGFLLLVVIVSVVLCIICCTKSNRGQVGQVVQGPTMVVAGSYPMQTTNMQPGINQWQQQPYHSNQTPNREPGPSQLQQPPPYNPPGEVQDKTHQ